MKAIIALLVVASFAAVGKNCFAIFAGKNFPFFCVLAEIRKGQRLILLTIINIFGWKI